MQSFQMVMNFLIMPIYFLSGAMFPMTSAPTWLKSLMALDPLTYGVDAIRNVVFSNTTIENGGVVSSLIDVARQGGLVRFDLGFDVALMALVAVALAAAGAWSFSKAQAA
jgi:ABC-2 type transport system permease protein